MADDGVSVVDVFKSRNTILKILKERGYPTSDYENYDISHVASMIDTDQLNMMIAGPLNKAFIHYQLKSKLNLNKVISSLYDEENAPLAPMDDLIIIYKAEPNDTLRAEMDELWNRSGIYVTILNIKRLQFNILEHVAVPKHRVLSEKEREEFFIKYNIKSNHDIPTISRYEPVASVHCMRPGQVCCIERKSKTAGNTLYYRVCVK
jgi:DNA-directed RNA polymerase I, II, and III subunit RPABC1